MDRKIIMENKKARNRGAASIVFILLLSVFVFFILLVAQSQVLLSIKRSASTIDTLRATYDAESEVNDVMARVIGGYIDITSFDGSVKIIGDTRLEIDSGKDEGAQEEIIIVTARRANAVSRVKAVRKIESIGNRMYKQKEIERKEALSGINYNNGIDFFTTNDVKGSENNDKIEFYADAIQKYLSCL